MPLPEKRDHRIALADAVEMTRTHRARNTGEPKAHFFHREAFDALLAQQGVAGIRIYRGNGKDGAHNLVVVAVDGDGEDMTTLLMEVCIPCPPACPPNSALQK